MSKPPKEIDGAKVLEWAWSGNNPFGVVHDRSGGVASEIYGLAICSYDNGNSVYRFSCDSKWETEQDSVYSTIEEAKRNLPDQYREVEPDWLKYG